MTYKTFQEYQQDDNKEELLWSDRKRYLGLPLSFTKYSLTNERLIRNTGFFNTDTNEVLLYRIMDIEMTQSFSQKLFNVGTIILHASDRSTPMIQLINVKKPADVKRYLSRLIETVRDEKNITGKEMFGAAAGYTRNQMDLDGDGILDYVQLDADGDGTPDYIQNNPIYREPDTQE